MRIFNAESPLMEGLSKVADLVILNLLVLLCCIPVITAGAALTGMHYVLIKMARDEEGYIVRSYFKSFKENFLQATGMWLIFLVLLSVFILDLRLTGGAAGLELHLPLVFRYLLIAFGVYAYMAFLYAFPLLARFRNTIFGTLRNAAVLAAASFPRTVAMTIVSIVLPLAAWLFKPLIPVLILAGMTGPGFVCALIYSPVFKKLEDRVRSDEPESSSEE